MTNASNLGKIINPIYPSGEPLAEANGKIQLGITLLIIGAVLIAIFGVGMPFVIAKVHENRKKVSTEKPIIIQKNYYYKIQRNKANRRKKQKRKGKKR